MDPIEEVINYYCDALENSAPAQQYLKSRGITDESIVKFRLGYCPHTPKFTRRFKDRIIFPIWDAYGVLIGWTGRTLVNDPAKYVNVKESALYKKGRLLYAYHLAKPFIIKTNAVVLVEGQMDTVILHQVGIMNTVATSGTAAFKLAAASLLARYDPRVYIVFDGDGAGQKAAIAAEVRLKEVGITDTIVVYLPEGEDPASFVLKYGKPTFLELLNDARRIRTPA